MEKYKNTKKKKNTKETRNKKIKKKKEVPEGEKIIFKDPWDALLSKMGIKKKRIRNIIPKNFHAI